MIESSPPEPKSPVPPDPERRPGWKTAVLYGLRVFIAVGLVVMFAAVVVRLHPPVFVWGLAAAGRSPMCSVGDLMVGANTRYRLGETAQEMRSRCQTIEQDEAGFDLWETPLGAFWIPAGNGWPLQVLVAQQLVEDYGNRDQGVQQGDIVLDCGAHVGVYTRKALQSGAAVVVAIEPSPQNIECLRRNFREEIAQGRVVIYAKGVWDKDEVLPFFELSQNTAASNFVVGRSYRSPASELRVSARYQQGPEGRFTNVGFRCALRDFSNLRGTSRTGDPELPATEGVFFRRNGNHEAVPQEWAEERPSFTSVLTLGLKKSKYAYVVQRETSSFSIGENRPLFLIHLPGSEVENFELLSVLDVNKGRRLLFLVGGEGSPKSRPVKVEMKEIAPGYLEFWPKYDLRRGEYAIVSAVTADDTPQVWSFTIVH